jgi:hypothetical protein
VGAPDGHAVVFSRQGVVADPAAKK